MVNRIFDLKKEYTEKSIDAFVQRKATLETKIYTLLSQTSLFSALVVTFSTIQFKWFNSLGGCKWVLVFLIGLTILCGISSAIFCLIAMDPKNNKIAARDPLSIKNIQIENDLESEIINDLITISNSYEDSTTKLATSVRRAQGLLLIALILFLFVGSFFVFFSLNHNEEPQKIEIVNGMLDF